MEVKHDYFPDRERFSLVVMIFGLFIMLPSGAVCSLTNSPFWCVPFMLSVSVVGAGAITGRAMIARYVRLFLDELEDIEERALLHGTLIMAGGSSLLFLWDTMLHYHGGKFTKMPSLLDFYMLIAATALMTMLYGLKLLTKRWARRSQ